VRRSWIFFVSARHFRTKRREKGHTAGILSVLGIAAGVMTLIAVLAVMNGFQFGTIEDILEIGSYHLQVDFESESDGASETAAIESDDVSALVSDLPGVRVAVPYAETYGLAYGYFPDPLAIVVRAVPRDILDRDRTLAANLEIVSGRWSLEPGSIVFGQELARRLGVRVGDTVEIVGFSGSFAPGAPTTTSFELTGVFKSGFLEYDAGWAFLGLGGGSGALDVDSASRVGVKLDDRFRDRLVARRITDALPGARVESWREYNRAIFGALRLEKTMMMLLIGLIFVVVAVNIYQSLRRSVVERTEEIGVLKAIGAPPLPLQLVFVLEGLWIGLAGGVVGLGLGLLVSLNINELFGAAEIIVNAVAYAGQWVVGLVSGTGAAPTGAFSIFSPAYFYLDEVPAVIVPAEVVAIVIFAVLSATVAALVASRRVSSIAPAAVLRYE